MNDLLQIIQGDALEKLRQLEAESVQCCVTSPPYWGLRDYGTAAWEGGEDECEHKDFGSAPQGTSHSHSPDQQSRKGMLKPYRDACGKCGAKRIDAQLGLEKTPEEYVAKMVAVFREVRRVLCKDGTLWLNLGDSYYGSWANYGGGDRGAGKQRLIKHGSSAQNPVWDGLEDWRPPASFKHDSIKPKDLVGIPWMVAFALRADGWWLRSDIIWAKPNPMPESVTDRPTKSHEYLFLLTKSASYFYDAEAIKEAAVIGATDKITSSVGPKHLQGIRFSGANGHNLGECTGNRNKRSVWTVATAPYPEAHFATYPPDLIKPCIMAGSRPGDTILDPFAGSGTTGMVALELGRKAVLIELNPRYIELIEQRCCITPGLALA